MAAGAELDTDFIYYCPYTQAERHAVASPVHHRVSSRALQNSVQEQPPDPADARYFDVVEGI